MNFVPLDDFLPMVLPFARGASDLAAMTEVRNAAIEFCKKTKVWRELLEPQNLVAGVPDIELPLPDGSDLVEIAEVFYHRDPLDPVAEDDLKLRGIYPGKTGTPECYTHHGDLFILRVAPIPMISETQALTVRAVLMPPRDADELVDVLFRRYATEIADGALERLHNYDEKWASRTKAGEYADKFRGACDSVHHKVAKSNTRAKRRTTPAYF